jgi:hypothetical protein
MRLHLKQPKRLQMARRLKQPLKWRRCDQLNLHRRSSTCAGRSGDAEISLSVTCQEVLSARCTLRNDGDDMTSVGTYTTKEPGQPPQTESLQFEGIESVTFTAIGNARVDATYKTNSQDKVRISAQGSCVPPATNTTTSMPITTPTNTVTAPSPIRQPIHRPSRQATRQPIQQPSHPRARRPIR